MVLVGLMFFVTVAGCHKVDCDEPQHFVTAMDFTTPTHDVFEALSNNGLVNLSPFISTSLLEKLRTEVVAAFDAHRQRRDFVSATDVTGGGTARNMFTVNKRNIDVHSGGKLAAFYSSEVFLNFLGQAARDKIFPIPLVNEWYLINGLAKKGDTQGWHWDGFRYAIVFIAQAPKEAGGQLQLITHSGHLNKTVHEISSTHPISSSNYFPSGSLVLMNGKESLHRVSPLEGDDDLRVSFVMSYADLADLNTFTGELDQSIVDLYG